MYLQMAPWMKAWFAARESVLPDSVKEWSEAFRLSDFQNMAPGPRRYDAAAMGQLLGELGEMGIGRGKAAGGPEA